MIQNAVVMGFYTYMPSGAPTPVYSKSIYSQLGHLPSLIIVVVVVIKKSIHPTVEVFPPRTSTASGQRELLIRLSGLQLGNPARARQRE